MPARVAALDLGTNTFHLVIADVDEGKIERLILARQIHAKLGEGGIADGCIAEPAFLRGVEALVEYKRIIDENKVDKILAVGTSALRGATNGADFISRVKSETGIFIEIIEGDREAELIYLGVRQAVDLSETSLIMDIGGGSVEFILADHTGILWKKSYPIGAARLMAMFHHSDPLSESDLKAVLDHLEEVLPELLVNAATYKPQVLIGSAGAFETFALLSELRISGEASTIKTSYQFEKTTLKDLLKDLIQSDHTSRKNNPAILPVRTDMIIMASAITDYILRELSINNVVMTSYALKEGLLVSV